MLELTGLGGDEETGTLSGGNRQRLNIAVGLLGDPPLLLLDEPSASLDPAQRERLWAFIAELTATVVFTTHDVGEAGRHADRVLVLAGGELLFSGTPAELAARRATSRPVSWSYALAPDQGSADPAPLAAAGGAARPVSGRRRRPDGRGADGRAREAARRVREPRRRRGDQPRRPRARSDELHRKAVRRDRPDPRRHPRRGDREGPRRRGARRARDPGRRGRAPPGPALAQPGRAADASRSSTTPRTRSSAATSSRRSGRGWPMPTRR